MYYIQNGFDTIKNTFDGNMKLQKLLVFANLISLAEHDVPLFSDEILAYTQGCVVERVRLRYKNDYINLARDSEKYKPDFTQDEYNVLNVNTSIFGKLSARELSEINHSFEFWKKAYYNSIQKDGYKDKHKAVVTVESMREELGKLINIINVFNDTGNENNSIEIINGIEFIYSSSDILLTDDLIDELYAFSVDADESSYSFYLDNGKLIIS
jgi:uncharacterized phage-associated protein